MEMIGIPRSWAAWLLGWLAFAVVRATLILIVVVLPVLMLTVVAFWCLE